MQKIIDKNYLSVASNLLIKLGGGAVLIFLVPLFLNQNDQGFWFTFSSVAALTTLVDMGLTTLLLQFSAHEFAHLSLKQKRLLGPEERIARISSLFSMCIKFSIFVILIFLPLLFLVGYYLFSFSDSGVEWEIPWAIYVFSATVVFLNNIFLSFIEGCDSVSESHLIRFWSNVTFVLIGSILLVQGLGLYALGFGTLGSGVVGGVLIAFKKKDLLSALRLTRKRDNSIRHELLKIFKKYAVTWGSSYFIFPIITSISFYFFDAAFAGKVGITLALFRAIYGLSFAWITSSNAGFNMLVSSGRIKEVHFDFTRKEKLSVISFVALCLLFLPFIHFLQMEFPDLGERFLGGWSIVFLAASWFLAILVNSKSTFVRAFKKELFYPVYLLAGFCSFLFSVFLGFLNYEEYFLIGNFLGMVFATILTYKIFRRFSLGMKSY